MEKTIQSFADKFISERTEQLVLKAEHQSAFQKEMHSLSTPRVSRCCPQTALRWFAGKVLRHKG